MPTPPTIHCASTRSTSGKTRHNRGDPDAAYIWAGGLVITAAHVVTPVARTKPSVRIAGMDLPAHAIKEGNFERVDLTLLSVDEQKLPIHLQMRRMPLCENRRGRESRSSSQFPRAQRAPKSCYRRCFPLTSK